MEYHAAFFDSNGLYCNRLGFVNFDLARHCQINPHPHPAHLGQGFVCL